MAESISSMQACKNTFQSLVIYKFFNPTHKTKIGIANIVVSRMVNTDQLIFGIANSLEKYVPTMPKI